ncbi:hypothetical protein HMPREF3227_00168 [Corynebacterium sp. CMW7794]|nr:hypothetical protein HMPREF3227_00168 [Corynebacterium sp. CMW7794]
MLRSTRRCKGGVYSHAVPFYAPSGTRHGMGGLLRRLRRAFRCPLRPWPSRPRPHGPRGGRGARGFRGPHGVPQERRELGNPAIMQALGQVRQALLTDEAPPPSTSTPSWRSCSAQPARSLSSTNPRTRRHSTRADFSARVLSSVF